MFDSKVFTPGAIIFTAIGTAALWARWGELGLRPFMLRKWFGLFLPDRAWRKRVEAVTFVVVGTIVGIGVVEPTTAAQAIAAGLGWTGLLAVPDAPHRTGKRQKT